MLNRTAAVLALVCLPLVAGCSDPPPPISLSDGMVTVHNQTEHDWSEVLITVNDHYRGYVKVLKSEGRANAPLSQLTTGHGQRWREGASVRSIVVTAKSAAGTDVKLSWSGG